MTVEELIKVLEQVENKDLCVRCSNMYMDVHIKNVKVEKNSFGSNTDEFVNIC